MKKLFFTFTLSVLSISSVLANPKSVNPALKSPKDPTYAKIITIVEDPLSAADVSVEAWTETIKPVKLTPSIASFLLPGVEFTIKNTITSGPYKGMVCWDLYTFAPNKTFTMTVFMINNNTACEVRGEQIE